MKDRIQRLVDETVEIHDGLVSLPRDPDPEGRVERIDPEELAVRFPAHPEQGVPAETAVYAIQKRVPDRDEGVFILGRLLRRIAE